MSDHLFVFANPKAGMDDVDRSKVNETIYNLSKDSAFFKNSLEKDAKTDAKIAALQAKLATKRRHDLVASVNALVDEFEANRNLGRIHVVIDMDMFFAAVEMRDRPELANVPMAVGGMGMISTTNYVARKFGVRAAMPGFIGKKLCPDLIFVSPDMAKYAAVADETRKIFALYDPQFMAASLDEAYLDITDICVARGATDEASMETTAAAITNELRQRIFEVTKLTASAGISTNAKLAKVCSDINKPNGQYLLPFNRNALIKFIENLPIRKLGGIGKVREKILAALGIHNGGDLFNARYDLFHIHSDITARWLLQVSMGVYEGHGHDERKSVSRETTFAATASLSDLRAICKDLVSHVRADLAEVLVNLQACEITGAQENVTGFCVTLKLKTEDFHVRTRAFTSKASVEPTLGDVACMLLEREVRHDQKTHKPPPRYRLMGVRISKLVERDADVAAGPTTNQLRLEDTALFAPETKVPCPVCDAPVPQRQLPRHTRLCLGEPMEDKCDAKAPEKPCFFKASGKRPAESDTVCPVCAVSLGALSRRAIASHVDACLAATEVTKEPETLESCPICQQSFESQSPLWMNRHLEACLAQGTCADEPCLAQGSDVGVACPEHSTTFPGATEAKLNAHISQCLLGTGSKPKPLSRHDPTREVPSIKSYFLNA
ncbi:DNA polymerase kappa [Achlya hypogyna]|uniref:DNA polymerase kappa n=1 Tax=Achlya hypogyna TaxID=1202772 RepID=A0A1V9YNG6_ACHHY|nr:DNA polymerase kappa [Achlya hypogyna]